MCPLSPQRGFGLVEIMVGLAIGMIASVVIFQVFSVSERQKRTTSGSADAQTTGAFSLYSIERDAKMAGFGLEANSVGACTKIYSYFNNGSGDSTISQFDSPAAISIKDGAGSAADEIQIIYFSNPSDANFMIPSSTTLAETMPSASAELKVTNVSGCAKDTLAMLQKDGICTVIELTQVQTTAQLGHLQHNPGGSGSPAAPEYNPSVPYMTAGNWPAYEKGATVRCGLGTPVSRTYRITAGSLEFQDSNTAPAQTVAANIVALQAQYGVAATGTLALNEWVDASGIWAEGTLKRLDGNGKRIKALRVALVARSAEYEKPEPGNACSTTTDAMVAGWSSWANLSAVKNLPDWQCYRYKAVETVVPLRNVIWANVK